MEKRLAKIIVGKSGGTAGKNSKSYKISLPTKWVDSLNLTEQNVELNFDGNKIVITPLYSFNEFLELKSRIGHKLIVFKFYDNKTLCTEICADYTDYTLSVQNEAVDVIKTAFGKNYCPTWIDFQSFLNERCIPQSRSGIREYLEAIGLEEYDTLEIIKKTSGRMAEDNQWIEIEKIK